MTDHKGRLLGSLHQAIAFSTRQTGNATVQITKMVEWIRLIMEVDEERLMLCDVSAQNDPTLSTALEDKKESAVSGLAWNQKIKMEMLADLARS